MNKQLNLAVAGAVLALSAVSANAGIMIPAGDWTLDIGGNVNTYYTSTRASGATAANSPLGISNSSGKTTSNITTGLLPNFLSVSGKTRQNDLDVGFTISINPGTSTTHAAKQSPQQENRQAFVTFGDASWGSVKLGKDLGIYASDALLSDMTLLGVGAGAGGLAGNTTTLGRIGTGFVYADWKSQIAYSSPNWNGFSFTAGVTQAWNGTGNSQRGGASPAFEGKASYEWAGDVGGKVWASGLSQKTEGPGGTASAWDLGATINVAGFGLTGYYGQGNGTGTTVLFNGGVDATGSKRDSDDYYVQGTYTIPGVGTKLGVSYGKSSLDGNSAAKEGLNGFKDSSNRMWTLGAYHPITKHLNLVAEYSDVKGELNRRGTGADLDGKAKTIALGAILFF